MIYENKPEINRLINQKKTYLWGSWLELLQITLGLKDYSLETENSCRGKSGNSSPALQKVIKNLRFLNTSIR